MLNMLFLQGSNILFPYPLSFLQKNKEVFLAEIIVILDLCYLGKHKCFSHSVILFFHLP